MDKITEWKDQWNHGDVKFVPELFELVTDLLCDNDRLKYQLQKDQVLHQQHYRQLLVQNKSLMDQLMKIHHTRTTPMTEIFIPAANITNETLAWLKEIVAKNKESR